MNVHVPQSGKRLLLSPISMAILALMAGTNVAYAAEEAQVAAAAAAPATEQAAPADAGKITEVSVTATKRPTSMQQTPVAVTALNSAALVADAADAGESFIGDEFDDRQDGEDADGSPVTHKACPGAGDRQPAEISAPGHGGGRSHGAQAGYDTDQQCKQVKHD